MNFTPITDAEFTEYMRGRGYYFDLNLGNMSKAKHYTLQQWKDNASPHVRAQLEAFEREGNQPKKNKFNARKVEHDGMIFDSKHELKQWILLCVRQKVGEISGLTRQEVFTLVEKQIGQRSVKYVADFTYFENGSKVVSDAKSVPTRKLPTYVIKKKLMQERHGVLIKEV